ncbi:MAG: DUF63 family protein [Methanobrevibacter sp.]|nr:DUF63 family protein [Candidatus Methanovirga procula]
MLSNLNSNMLILQKYFFSGYNLINTTIYILICILTIFTLYKLFKKLKVDPIRLIAPSIPFILMGAIIRVFVDNHILEYNYFLITPGLILILAIISSLSFCISLYLEKKLNVDYNIILLLMGSILSLYLLFKIKKISFIPLTEVIILWIFINLIFIIFNKKYNLLKNKYNLSIYFAHTLDATSTFISVDLFNYNEEHILPNFILSSAGTSMILIPYKIAIILFSIYLIDSNINNKTLNGLLKLVIFVLGLAPALRNILSLITS